MCVLRPSFVCKVWFPASCLKSFEAQYAILLPCDETVCTFVVPLKCPTTGCRIHFSCWCIIVCPGLKCCWQEPITGSEWLGSLRVGCSRVLLLLRISKSSEAVLVENFIELSMRTYYIDRVKTRRHLTFLEIIRNYFSYNLFRYSFI